MHNMNERSLENLKKPKPKKEGHGYRYKIPQDKIDELFSYMAGDGMTLKKASKEAGICFETARKYYREGDASRGIKPIIQRLEIFQENISKELNVLLEEQRTERLTVIRKLIDKAQETLLGPITKFYNKAGDEIEVYDKDKKKIETFNFGKIKIRDIERLMKLETYIAGGVTKSTKETKILTAEQIDAGNTTTD